MYICNVEWGIYVGVIGYFLTVATKKTTILSTGDT
jgi:hypothetical protein